MAWMSDAAVKALLAATKRNIDGTELTRQAYWDSLIHRATLVARGKLIRALVGLGYTAAQAAAWDDGLEFHGDQSLYEVGRLALKDFDDNLKPYLETFNRIPELTADLDVLIDGELVTPGAGFGGVRYGLMRTGYEVFDRPVRSVVRPLAADPVLSEPTISYEDETVPAELVAHYPLDVDGLDHSGNGQPLTMTAAMFGTVGGETALTAGKGERAAGLVGLAASKGSISFWFLADNLWARQGGVLFGGGMLASSLFGLTAVDEEANPAAVGVVVIGSGGAQILTTVGAAVLAVGVRHHACVTWDGTTLRLYLDGLLVTSSAAVAPGDGWESAVLTVDTNPALVTPMPLDDVRIYDAALTAAEVAALAAE